MSANFGFAYWDENGTNRTEMDELGISYYDENETVRVAITNSGIVYFDENGTDRVAIGRVGIVTPSTGATTTYPAQASLYDAEGNVIWSALGGR